MLLLRIQWVQPVPQQQGDRCDLPKSIRPLRRTGARGTQRVHVRGSQNLPKLTQNCAQLGYSDDHLLVITGYNWDYTFYKWGFVSCYNW